MDTVGLRWSTGTVRLRTFDAAGRPGRWRSVAPGCAAGADGAPALRSALVGAGGAVSLQIDLPPGATAVVIDATAPPPQLSAATGVEQLYMRRADWGCDESLRFDSSGAERLPTAYFPVQTVTVHHTATVNDDPDPAARIRAIYRFQTIDENFGDVGYQFFIDESGRLYEGRWSGTDGIPGFDQQGRMVNAAHVGGYNAGNVGIALLGDLTARPPTAAARRTLILVLAMLSVWHGIDPLGRRRYINPISGVTAEVPAIAGHRDWPVATQCPGNTFHPLLPGIRQSVAELLRA